MSSTAPFAPHVSFLTLAVSDVARARAFYEALGLPCHARSGPGYAFFQLNGIILALYGAEDLARTWGGEDTGTGPTVALSHNVLDPGDIDRILAAVDRAGGRICVPRGPTPWGGERAWFADLDGHRWEVVYNPKLQRDAHGGAWLSSRSPT